MKWRFDTPPTDRWIVALEHVTNLDVLGDLPPIVVYWDGYCYADGNGYSYHIRAWAECPQPQPGKRGPILPVSMDGSDTP